MTETCVGCGAVVGKIDGPVHRYMTSAPGCWERYGELLGTLAIDPAAGATRVLCVDAYATQHPGSPNSQAIQSVAIHLLNMYGYLVQNRPVGIPQKSVTMQGHKGEFRWLEPPSFAQSRTVLDVPFNAPGDTIAKAAHEWAASTWAAWSRHHAQIAAWSARYSRSPAL